MISPRQVIYLNVRKALLAIRTDSESGMIIKF
jgi:hypothetical protein